MVPKYLQDPSVWVEFLWREVGLDRQLIRRFLQIFPSPGLINLKALKAIRQNRPIFRPGQEETLLQKLKPVKASSPRHPYISFLAPAFPAMLQVLHDPPCILYFRGKEEILQHPGPWIAVVGTRRASPHGLAACEKLIREMKPYQPVIVSGMAQGIDGRAHQLALELGLPTVAVLGTSLDRIYPARHLELQHRMAREGLLLSEQYPGAVMGPWRFPERNRIIAALCDAIILVEAPLKSGALLTANFALEIGREVFVVPGPITAPHNQGGHRLVNQGAPLLTEAKELFDLLGTPHKAPENTDPQKLSVEKLETLGKEEKILLESLSQGPTHIDKLVEISHLPAPLVTSLLTDLCLKGWILESDGGQFKIV